MTRFIGPMNKKTTVKNDRKRARKARLRQSRSTQSTPTNIATRARPNNRARLVGHPGNLSGGPGDATHFQRALEDPFSAAAEGARVVDSYVIPTATYHIRSAQVCTSSAGGLFCCAVLPNPCLSYIVAPATTFGSITGGGYTAFTQNTQGAAVSGAGYLISPTTLSASLTEYRVVSWGMRLIAKDTAFASKGKVYLAAVPTTNNAPSWNTFETVTAAGGSMGEYTFGMNEGNLSVIQNLPGVRVFSMQDLLRGEILACGVPTHADYYSFKGTSDRSNVAWNTGQVLADEGVFNNTTGLVNATAGGRKDIASLRGGRAFIIYASGLPASSNEFDIELVYHLEGTPNMAASAGALVPSGMRATVGSTSMVERIVSMASHASRLFRFVTDPTNQAAAMRAVRFLKG